MTALVMAAATGRARLDISVEKLLSTLAGIEETLLFYQGERARPRPRRMLTDIEPPLIAAPRGPVRPRHRRSQALDQETQRFPTHIAGSRR